MNEIRLEALILLLLVPIGFVVLLICLLFAAKRCFKHKDWEREIYLQIAGQMNWNFSAQGEGLENAKSYFEYINHQILPDRLRLGTFPVNILWGTLESTRFASFDFNYNNSLNSANYNIQQEKGVLLVFDGLNLPAFEITEKDFLLKSLQYVPGSDQAAAFAKNYQIKVNDREFASKVFKPEILKIFVGAGIVRVMGNENMLCLFFRKTEGELPEIGRIHFQLNTGWQLARSFK